MSATRESVFQTALGRIAGTRRKPLNAQAASAIGAAEHELSVIIDRVALARFKPSMDLSVTFPPLAWTQKRLHCGMVKSERSPGSHDVLELRRVNVLLEPGDLAAFNVPDVADLRVHALPCRFVRSTIAGFNNDAIASTME